MNADYLLRTKRDVSKFLNEISDEKVYIELGNCTKQQYFTDVKKYLEKLPFGTKIEINTLSKASNLKLFIQCVCMFTINNNDVVEFSNDYEYIIKLNRPEYLPTKTKQFLINPKA